MVGECGLSFRAVIIPEDPTNNGYILKPLIKHVLAACGRPNARVEVVTNPRTSGYEHAKALIKSEFCARYSFADVILFLADADGKNRSREFTTLEDEAREQGAKLVCCAAAQEVETWLLAGHTDKLSISWLQVRADVSVKENVFEPFMRVYGDARKPGGGRADLMSTTLQNYGALKTRCPEIAQLEERLRAITSAPQ